MKEISYGVYASETNPICNEELHMLTKTMDDNNLDGIIIVIKDSLGDLCDNAGKETLCHIAIQDHVNHIAKDLALMPDSRYTNISYSNVIKSFRDSNKETNVPSNINVTYVAVLFPAGDEDRSLLNNPITGLETIYLSLSERNRLLDQVRMIHHLIKYNTHVPKELLYPNTFNFYKNCCFNNKYIIKGVIENDIGSRESKSISSR